MPDKFILADPSEERHLHSSVRELCEFVTGVEEITGADFIISPLSIPFVPALIRRHARAGLCVQRKEVSDLVASISDGRLWSQLLRLLEMGDLIYLLIIGDIKCDKEGNAVVDGRDTQMKYQAIVSTIERWQLRGGYVTWLSRETLIAHWSTMWRNALVDRENNEGRFPDKVVRKPLQLLYPIPKVQEALMGLPGIGEDKAKAIYSLALTRVPKPTLMDCYYILADEKVDGIGKTIRDRCMSFIGWQDVNQQEENSQ